jgi:hypothetical protein
VQKSLEFICHSFGTSRFPDNGPHLTILDPPEAPQVVGQLLRREVEATINDVRTLDFEAEAREPVDHPPSH